MAAAEAGVDIHHHHVGRATIEHSQERGQALKMSPVTNACRHRDHRAIDEPPHHAGQGSFHAGDDHERIGIAQLGKLVQQAVQTGHTHIGHQRHLAVPGQGGDTCLLGHGKVARTCRDDHHPAHLAARLGRALDPKGSANRIVLALGESRPQMIRDRRIDPCDQPPLFMLDQCAQDGLDLRRGLALAEDHFGESAPDATVQIHLGEAAGINIGLGLEPKRGIGHRHFSGGDRRQNLLQLMRVHEPSISSAG